MTPTVHRPVLLYETIEALAVRHGSRVVDATFGGGGLSRALCERYGAGIALVGIDADAGAIRRGEEAFENSSCRIQFFTSNFSDLETMLDRAGYVSVEGIAFDLGLSSDQLERSGRGFSFRRDEPLTMTFAEDDAGGITAEEIVNGWSEAALRSILAAYGEERFAGRISRSIVESREHRTIVSTRDLVEVIEQAVPQGYRQRRIHPATKTFQALRMAVNDEVTALERGLQGAFRRLSAGGRLAVIAFHSLEDRIVKSYFREWERNEAGRRITKKPIRPSREEELENPRSRSAKLRVMEKL